MLLTEWNWDDALEVAREEALKEGEDRVLALWESGVPLPEAKQKLGLLQ